MKVQVSYRLTCRYPVVLPHRNSWAFEGIVNGASGVAERDHHVPGLGFIQFQQAGDVPGRHDQKV